MRYHKLFILSFVFLLHSCGDDENSKNQVVEICNNRIDDDGDSLIDCNDSDCINTSFCQNQENICDDAIDNDKDGVIDCFDKDCKNNFACKEWDIEICNNEIDDDGDNLVDCEDLDCIYFDYCK